MSASLKRYLLSPENWMEMLVRLWNLLDFLLSIE